MKVKAIKNFFLFSGERIVLDSEYEIKDEIALDLIKGKFVIEASSELEKKATEKVEKKVSKTSKKKKVEE